MPRRHNAWPADDRARALDLFATEGLAAAHQATGIPKGTIRSWAKTDGVPRFTRADDKRTTTAATAEYAEILDRSRERRTLQLATAAELALDRLLTMLEANTVTIPPRDLVGIFTRANHDLALLTNAATENLAVQVVFNVPPPAPEPPQVHRQDDLPAIGA